MRAAETAPDMPSTKDNTHRPSTMPKYVTALLPGWTFLTQTAWTMIQTTEKIPQVTIERSRQMAQCKLGGDGYGETAGPGYAAGAATAGCGTAGTGMLPIT